MHERTSREILATGYDGLVNSRPLIIVLGAGLEHQSPSEPPRLWIGHQTKLRTDAAATLWKQNPESLMIVSGGRSSPTSPSEAEVMKDYLVHDPWNIPESTIFTENESIDTASNVRNVVSLIKKNHWPADAITLVTGRRHCRATRYFRAHGIRVVSCIAADLLGVPREDIAPKDRMRDIILNLVQFVDRKGYLPTRVKRLQRRGNCV
jgi:uncharacterized SAM-binding protein YcdF (DUF218 family)